MATFAVLLLMVGVWQWRPWVEVEPGGSASMVAVNGISSPPREILPISGWNPYAHRILPGAEELLSPVRALEADLERPLTQRATLQDDMVLDLAGSDEVFQHVEGILREVHGKMFLMGVRHRGSGQVIRSRLLIQVPLDSYDQVVHRIESLGHVQRLFLDRGAVPLPPDRLRIRVVAVDSTLGNSGPALQAVSWE
jgi:hypothetical protein